MANEVGDSMSYPHIAFFDMGMMLAATNNFSPSNKLGQGGFGLVYKVHIYSSYAKVLILFMLLNSIPSQSIII